MNIKLSLATILTTSTILFSSAAQAQPIRSIGNGATTLRLNSTFNNLLQDENITARPVEESTTIRGSTVFPIHEGLIDLATARAEIEHAGGQRLTNSVTVLRLMNYIIDSTQIAPILTADVVVNDQLIGRLPLFDVQFPTLSTPLQPRRGLVRFTNGTLTLRSEGADALNTVFATTAFAAGQTFGTINMNLVLGRSVAIPTRFSTKSSEK